MLIHSYNIRTVLMAYYRFERQFSCCNEVQTDCFELADLLVDAKKYFIEIEIKTSKQDLMINEQRKRKHKKEDTDRLINKFYICVPSELINDAKEWVRNTNSKYGIIEFNTEIAKFNTYKHRFILSTIKKAELLQSTRKSILEEKMKRRLSSALVHEYIEKIN